MKKSLVKPLLVALVGFIIMERVIGTGNSLMVATFVFSFIANINSRAYFVLTIISLLLVMSILIYGDDILAEKISVFTVYLLTLAVFLEIKELIIYARSKNTSK